MADAKRQQGALLDASGHSISEVTALLGVSESTVSRWRRDPDYQAEVERLREKQVQAVAPLLEHIKSQVVEGATKALRTLEDALEATDDDGQPLWTTRMEAASKIRRWMESEFPSRVASMRAAADGNGTSPGTQSGAGPVQIIIAGAAAEGAAVRPRKVDQPEPPQLEAPGDA